MLWQIPELPQGNQWKVVSNLPYHLTSKILKTLAKNRNKISLSVVMVEKGYAEDLLAMKANQGHDATSFVLHYAFEPSILFPVSKNCFFPKPKVDSAILLLKSKPLREHDADFITFIEILFGHKRKTIQSILKNSFDVNFFPSDAKLQPILGQRAETLSCEEAEYLFVIFYDQIKKCVHEKEAKTQRYKMGLDE
jgi:16S rRNA (adenine1518-N6/adenine1519-N6)-dimethyltransferase